MFRSLAAATAIALVADVAVADEGMWTFDNVPQAAIQQKYGVTLDKPWLDKLQRSIARLENGCTGSFVSPDGLVLTNHHCAMQCLSELSSTSANYVDDGFNAATREGEKKCPTQMVSVLVEMEDVTAKVNGATTGLPDAQANQARKQELSKLEAACTENSKKNRSTGPLACESVTLYQGGQYFLYKYRRYDDVRLAFAPHHSIAAFGGDPDNFNFPRWSLDFSLMRVYEKGKPARTPTHLKWRVDGAQPGEATFVAGHPGTTSRLLTLEQLRFHRDVSVPSYLIRNTELRGRMIQWGKTGDEPARIASDYLQSIENSLKVYRGLQTALLDDALFQRKGTQERELRAGVATDPKLNEAAGKAWDDVAKAQERYRQIYNDYLFLEAGAGFNSKLFGYARTLVRGAAERGKSNEQRLREYAESNLSKVEAGLLATTPVYPDFEQVTLSYSLDKMRENLGPDAAIVRKLMSSESPESLAAKLVTQSKLGDPAVRKALWDGGSAAIASSQDPMIALARDIDGDARAVRKIYEDEVQAPVAASQEKIAKVRFAVLGTNTYPDATFTLRLSYGAVDGWTEQGEKVEPYSKLSRLYERTTGKDPFRLPQVWLDARDKLDLATPYCFVTTNDIVGGNSGSPLVDSKGQLVGLAFDGNIHSIAGSYWFDGKMNRTVAVHPAIMITALRDVYGAKGLANELLGTR